MAANSRITKPALDANQILIAEFQYIAQSAFQANEDRARVSNYYLVAVAAAIGALIGFKIEGAPLWGLQTLYWGFCALFSIVSFIGLLTVLMLARLRKAWYRSAVAMDKIKEYYRVHCSDPELADALVWRMDTIPTASKINTVAFWLATSVIAIDVPLLVVAIALSYIALNLPQSSAMQTIVQLNLVPAILTGIVYTIIQYLLYYFSVKE